MQNDKTTLKDLSIFASDGVGDVFTLIDRTSTYAGKETLRNHLLHPPDNPVALKEVQDVVKFWAANPGLWPEIISNGTLVMLDKYFDAADNVSAPPAGFSLWLNVVFKNWLFKEEYFLIQFSLSHLSDFLKGCKQLSKISEQPDVPALLLRELSVINEELRHRLTNDITGITRQTKYTELSQLNYKARREMKNMVYRLMKSYARIDAWQAMARATTEHKWQFPELLPALPVRFETKGVRHPLLQSPVSYSISFDQGRHFLLLTGANMSGKTTLLRAIGVGALLAHLGMGVPAESLSISFLAGIITNMQVEDNIQKGESYFFAEVQRMKQTAEKIHKPQPHLVLMDELFKGTNVHDAYECTKAVIEGLMNHPDHLMVLSTHLYEVAQQFIENDKIHFSHFVTKMAEDGSYVFTYEIKNGISDDRIGYRILQKEGVIDLLNAK